jgi:DNA-binding LacI/PurR family transcriptional regulator
MSTIAPLTIRHPLPFGRKSEALVEQMINHLLQTRPATGVRYFSETELAKLSRLSRPTIRKALDTLHRQGWIERKQGKGTFVGPRVAIGRPVAQLHTSDGTRTVRMAVVCPAWEEHYWSSFIQALDGAAEEHALQVEMVALKNGDSPTVALRISQTRPDVVICIGDLARQAPIIGEVARLGIPCITPRLQGRQFGLSGAAHDDHQGARLAVEQLRLTEHSRIAIVLRFGTAPHSFERYEGYIHAMRAAGLSTDGLVLWIPDHGGEPTSLETFSSLLLNFLEHSKPTALISGTCAMTEHLTQIISQGKLRVPADLSVVGFHTDTEPYWAAGERLTTIALPMRQLGMKLASIARRVTAGEKLGVELIPCKLVPGTTVRPPVRADPEE